MRDWTVSERVRWTVSERESSSEPISVFPRVSTELIQTFLSVIISNFRDSVMISCSLGQINPENIPGAPAPPP